eukprot:scaffold34818_cov68-Phaeocystis_antarctica.AAC.2
MGLQPPPRRVAACSTYQGRRRRRAAATLTTLTTYYTSYGYRVRTEEEGDVEQRLSKHHVGVVDEGAAAWEALCEEDVVEVRVAVDEGEGRRGTLLDDERRGPGEELSPVEERREGLRLPDAHRAEGLGERVGEVLPREEEAPQALVGVQRPLQRRLAWMVPPARVQPSERADRTLKVLGHVAAADARVRDRIVHDLEQHEEGRLPAPPLRCQVARGARQAAGGDGKVIVEVGLVAQLELDDELGQLVLLLRCELGDHPVWRAGQLTFECQVEQRHVSHHAQPLADGPHLHAGDAAVRREVALEPERLG